MKRLTVLLFIALVGGLFVIAACGKSDSAPSPTVSNLSLSPATDWVKIKGTEHFSVTALYSTGASESVSPAWTSNNTGVATVDSAGLVTGVAAGQATVVATYQSKTAMRDIRVIPDYAGRWAGSWSVTSCATTGALPASWCNSVQGASLPATLQVLQTKDQVSAAWTLQESNGTAQGSIAGDGKLTLSGSSLQSGVTIEIVSWQTVTTDNQQMTGTFTLKWTPTGVNGSAQTVVVLQNFRKQ
jgi:hypothetical protein